MSRGSERARIAHIPPCRHCMRSCPPTPGMSRRRTWHTRSRRCCRCPFPVRRWCGLSRLQGTRNQPGNPCNHPAPHRPSSRGTSPRRRLWMRSHPRGKTLQRGSRHKPSRRCPIGMSRQSMSHKRWRRRLPQTGPGCRLSVRSHEPSCNSPRQHQRKPSRRSTPGTCPHHTPRKCSHHHSP